MKSELIKSESNESENGPHTDSLHVHHFDHRFRHRAIKAVFIATAMFTGFFFLFLVFNTLFEVTTSNWLLKMVNEHPAGTIGIAMSAITAFCAVAILEFTTGAPIKVEFLSFKFDGASGPVLFWILCFLAMVFAHHLLWDLKM